MARELERGAELGAGTDPGAVAGEERGRGGHRLPAAAVMTATVTGTVAATATAAAVATVSGVLTIQTVCQTVRAVCRPTIAGQNRPSLYTLVLVRRTTVLEKSAGRREEDGAGAGTGCRTRSRNSRRSRSGGHRPPATAAATAAATATGPTTATATVAATVAAVGTLDAIGQSVVAVRSQPSVYTTQPWSLGSSHAGSEFSHLSPLGNGGRYRACAAFAPGKLHSCRRRRSRAAVAAWASFGTDGYGW